MHSPRQSPHIFVRARRCHLLHQHRLPPNIGKALALQLRNIGIDRGHVLGVDRLLSRCLVRKVCEVSRGRVVRRCPAAPSAAEMSPLVATRAARACLQSCGGVGDEVGGKLA